MKEISKISLSDLKPMAEKMYGNMVKGVVDVARGILVLDAEMHADEEAYLLEKGSKQEDLWGINLHPGKFGTEEFIEYDSMINIRPRQNNMSRGVEDAGMRKRIADIVKEKVSK